MVLFSGSNLWRHIIWSSCFRSFEITWCEFTRETKINDLQRGLLNWLVLLDKKEVFRFQVSVHDSVFMKVEDLEKVPPLWLAPAALARAEELFQGLKDFVVSPFDYYAVKDVNHCDSIYFYIGL